MSASRTFHQVKTLVSMASAAGTKRARPKPVSRSVRGVSSALGAVELGRGKKGPSILVFLRGFRMRGIIFRI